MIADEAHSSQSGQISSKLKAVLTAEELTEVEEAGEVDVEAILSSEMTERAASENISYFAFTATPKDKTLTRFGRPGPDGKPVAFHLYSMRQAIEEGYILDVLKGYQTYETALKIANKLGNGNGNGNDAGTVGEVEESAARRGLMRWVQLHPTNISQKVQIIVEHFHINVAHLLEGKAKAMVVTDSRKAAVKYKKAIDAYMARRAADDPSYNYRTLVAPPRFGAPAMTSFSTCRRPAASTTRWSLRPSRWCPSIPVTTSPRISECCTISCSCWVGVPQVPGWPIPRWYSR